MNKELLNILIKTLELMKVLLEEKVKRVEEAISTELNDEWEIYCGFDRD